MQEAVTADLQAMAKPRKGATAFVQLANTLDAGGFPEGAACFRPTAPRSGLVFAS